VLSVNLSPVQFKSGALVGDVTAALNSSALRPAGSNSRSQSR
jgi:EAL domain-containing protein (putative c-di-GMP-specific phosphodiesterase class I)